MMERTDYKELSAKIFSLGTIGIGLVLFVKYLLPYFIPFIIAWAIAYLIYPIAKELSEKTKMSRKLCSFFLLLLLLLIILSAGFLLVNRLLFEGQRLFDYLIDNSDKIAQYFKEIFDFINSITDRIPILNRLENVGLGDSISKNINELIDAIWKSIVEMLGTVVPNFAAGIVKILPEIIFVSLITVISCFYFALDIELINSSTKRLIPKKIGKYVFKIKDKISWGVKKYIKAYLIIFAITFLELFVGFLILGIDYSFVLAVIIAFVDFLPVFGTAAILLPWGIILLMMKKYFLGVCVLILLTIISIIRQIIEPRIVGKSLGVHPLITLVTLYVGYKIFGIAGMIFLPIITIMFLSKTDELKDKTARQ